MSRFHNLVGTSRRKVNYRYERRKGKFENRDCCVIVCRCYFFSRVFSFEAINAGHIGYKGEQVDDVTIFGIYPEIKVGSARKSLRAYGFYVSPYGGVKNCHITGEGFVTFLGIDIC